MRFIVRTDITYREGTLRGLRITNGHSVSFSTRTGAARHVQLLQRVQREEDFFRAAVTGNRYDITGPISCDVDS